MSFLEIAGIALGSAGLFASILGAWLSYAARHNGEATRSLIKEMNTLAEGRQKGTENLLREIWTTSEQRHREVIEAIEAISRRMA